jgi:hypothetical protein
VPWADTKWERKGDGARLKNPKQRLPPPTLGLTEWWWHRRCPLRHVEIPHPRYHLGGQQNARNCRCLCVAIDLGTPARTPKKNLSLGL